MELLKKHFQEFISGLMSLPINLPGTKLYQSLQASQVMRLISFTMYSMICLKVMMSSHLVSGKKENGEISEKNCPS